MGSIMIDCEEAAYLISKSENEDIGLKNRILLGIHVMACKNCRNYYKQSKLISAITSKMKVEDFSIPANGLCDSKKDEMKDRIRMELGKKD